MLKWDSLNKRLIITAVLIAMALVAAPAALAGENVVPGDSERSSDGIAADTYVYTDNPLEIREAFFNAAAGKVIAAVTQEQDKVDALDKTELEKAIEAAEAYNEEDYTADSWSVFQEAVSEAKTAMDNDEASQNEIDGAVGDLQAAVKSLVSSAGDAEDADSGDAVIAPATASFSKNDITDLVLKLDTGDYTLESLTCGDYTLVEDEDYSVDGAAYIITKGYLATLAVGEHVLVLNMSGGVNPTLTVTIKEAAVPEVTQPPAAVAPFDNPYLDINENQWFYDSVAFAYTRGFMKGTSLDPMMFSPFIPTTRGMIITIMYRIAGCPDVSDGSIYFKDVLEDDYYADAVKWGMSNGIIQGYGNGYFGPNDSITREQLVLIIYRYEALSGDEPPYAVMDKEFVDWDMIGNLAQEAARQLYRQGIITTKQGDIFEPTGLIARGELVAVMKRYVEAIE